MRGMRGGPLRAAWLSVLLLLSGALAGCKDDEARAQTPAERPGSMTIEAGQDNRIEIIAARPADQQPLLVTIQVVLRGEHAQARLAGSFFDPANRAAATVASPVLQLDQPTSVDITFNRLDLARGSEFSGTLTLSATSIGPQAATAPARRLSLSLRLIYRPSLVVEPAGAVEFRASNCWKPKLHCWKYGVRKSRSYD